MAPSTTNTSDLTARLQAAQAQTHGRVRTLTVPAGFGKAFLVALGQSLRIETPLGGQSAVLFAFRADDQAEWLSPAHTWARTHSLRPRVGDELLSTKRRPFLLFLEDGGGGGHDMLLPACDEAAYEQLGAEPGHRSCAGNLGEALTELGVRLGAVPAPVNFFAQTTLHNDGSMARAASTAEPGSYVVLQALGDLICVVSSCPSGGAPEWSAAATSGPTRLQIEIT